MRVEKLILDIMDQKQVGIIFLSVLLGFIMQTSPGKAITINQSITVYVEGTLGVTIEGPDQMDCVKGEMCSIWLKIVNEGNIRDIIMLTSNISSQGKGWVDYNFWCAETTGECKGKKVENIILTPDIGETRVALQATPYKRVSVPVNITITGWSQTNQTYQSLKSISLNIKEKRGFLGIVQAPGLQTEFIPILFLLAILLYGVKIKEIDG